MHHKQIRYFFNVYGYKLMVETFTTNLNIPKFFPFDEEPSQNSWKSRTPMIFCHDDFTFILGAQMMGCLGGWRLKLSLDDERLKKLEIPTLKGVLIGFPTRFK